MVFEDKKSIDVVRFNNGRSENKMAANMAEIWYSTAYISSSMKSGDQRLMATLWFSRSINAMTSSHLTLDGQKTRWQPIWWKYGIKMAITHVLSQVETQ